MIGDRIRMLRRKAEMTQMTLGIELGVSAAAVVLWETGKRAPDGEMIKKIAKVFNVTTDWLLFGDENNLQLSLPKTENTITILGRKGTMKTYIVDDAKFKELITQIEELSKDE